MMNKKIKYRLLVAIFLSVMFFIFNIFNPRFWIINDTGAIFTASILTILIFLLVEFVILKDLNFKERVSVLILYIPLYALFLLIINSSIVYSGVNNDYVVISSITLSKKDKNGCLLLNNKTSYLCVPSDSDGKIKVFKAWNYLVIVPDNNYVLIPNRE